MQCRGKYHHVSNTDTLTPDRDNWSLSIPSSAPSLGPDTFSHLYRNSSPCSGGGHVEANTRVEEVGKVRSVSPANESVKSVRIIIWK